MNKNSKFATKRLLILIIVFISIFILIDQLLLNFRTRDEKSQKILRSLEENKILTTELHSVFSAIENDFIFFEKKILNLIKLKNSSSDYNLEVKSLIDFLETHSGYFKVRLTNFNGNEVFKLVQKPDRTGFYNSSDLYNLSTQQFYKNLSQASGRHYYFSSMEPNIVNGIVEKPLRPTIRVAKRVTFKSGFDGLLILNIDGQKVLNLFNKTNYNPLQHKVSLIDHEGNIIATSSGDYDKEYPLIKKSFKEKSQKNFIELINKKNYQGTLNDDKELILFTQLLLPNTNEKWFLLTHIPESSWSMTVSKERFIWFSWELFCFILIIALYWHDEKKRHEDEVVKVLLKERNEFIQNVSHQLKTPLAIMMNLTENVEPIKKDWNELHLEVKYLSRLVEDMLLLAQVEAIENIPLQNEDILEILSSAIDLINFKAKSKNISIRFNVGEVMPGQLGYERPVMGDLLKSAIFNLLDNALDFSPNGEVVHLSVKIIGEKVQIEIKDNGPGMSQDRVDKLFTRFNQDKRKAIKSTGLGLAISKKIIDLHRGNIWLKDFRNGTTFVIEL